MSQSSVGPFPSQPTDKAGLAPKVQGRRGALGGIGEESSGVGHC